MVREAKIRLYPDGVSNAADTWDIKNNNSFYYQKTIVTRKNEVFNALHIIASQKTAVNYTRFKTAETDHSWTRANSKICLAFVSQSQMHIVD